MSNVPKVGRRAEIFGDGSAKAVPVSGEIDSATAPAFHEVLDLAVERAASVVVDLGAVWLMDSSGALVLERAAALAIERRPSRSEPPVSSAQGARDHGPSGAAQRRWRHPLGDVRRRREHERPPFGFSVSEREGPWVFESLAMFVARPDWEDLAFGRPEPPTPPDGLGTVHRMPAPAGIGVLDHAPAASGFREEAGNVHALRVAAGASTTGVVDCSE